MSVSVLWPAVPLVGLRCVTVVFPDHNHLHFNIKLNIKERNKATIGNRYNQAPHLTKDINWQSYKYTVKHHTQESQEISHFPAGDHMATVKRQENMTNIKHK